MAISARVALVCTLAVPASVAAQSVECALKRASDSTYQGPCVAETGPGFSATIAAHPAAPPFVWRGELRTAAGEQVPIAVAPPSGAFYSSGVIETPAAWLLLSVYDRSEQGLRFAFKWGAEAPPTPIDLRIIRRAETILADSIRWDRADDRVCTPQDLNWSLYCALHRATTEITGEFHHRQPALQVVRRVVAQLAPTRIASHRLMDFNNHPNTRFADIRSVLQRAAAAVDSQVSGRP